MAGLSVIGTEPSLFWAPHPRRPRSLGSPLCRNRGQVASSRTCRSPRRWKRRNPCQQLAPEFFDLLPRPLREPIAHRSTQPSHPLMHRLLSGRLGRNVGPDPLLDYRCASQFEQAQNVSLLSIRVRRLGLLGHDAATGGEADAAPKSLDGAAAERITHLLPERIIWRCLLSQVRTTMRADRRDADFDTRGAVG